MRKSRIAYICGVDFQHELGEVLDGTELFSSVKSLKKHRKCWVQCGILKVKVTPVKWEEPQDFRLVDET